MLQGGLSRAIVSLPARSQNSEFELIVEPLPACPDRFLGLLLLTNHYLAERRVRAEIELRSTIESIIGGFAHEVRNPLASILSLAEAAIDDLAETPHETSDLMRVPALVGRIEKLLQQSLAYSRPKPPQKAVAEYKPAGI